MGSRKNRKKALPLDKKEFFFALLEKPFSMIPFGICVGSKEVWDNCDSIFSKI